MGKDEVVNWLRDPLVLFLLLGGALAALHAATRAEEPETPADLRIVVTDADVNWLTVRFQKTWNRDPTLEEMRNLVDHRIRDEMLYRESVALGIDKADGALRRRMALKVEYLAKDAAGLAEPTEAELQAYLAAHPERFAIEPRRRFTHVYVSREKRGAEAASHAKALLARLRAEATLDPASLADVFLLEPSQPLLRKTDVERSFGAAFAEALFALEPGGWRGPVASTYGLHVVRVEEVEPGRAPPLEQVRDRVRTEVIEARQREVFEAYIERLREKYRVELRTTLLGEKQP